MRDDPTPCAICGRPRITVGHGSLGAIPEAGHKFVSAPALLAERDRLRFILSALLEGTNTKLHPNDASAIRAALSETKG